MSFPHCDVTIFIRSIAFYSLLIESSYLYLANIREGIAKSHQNIFGLGDWIYITDFIPFELETHALCASDTSSISPSRRIEYRMKGSPATDGQFYWVSVILLFHTNSCYLFQYEFYNVYCSSLLAFVCRVITTKSLQRAMKTIWMDAINQLHVNVSRYFLLLHLLLNLIIV